MDIHTRNIIRKQIENKDKNKLYELALKEEENLINTRKNVLEFIKYYPIYLCSDLINKDDLWLERNFRFLTAFYAGTQWLQMTGRIY
jgi:hypothetical protein